MKSPGLGVVGVAVLALAAACGDGGGDGGDGPAGTPSTTDGSVPLVEPDGDVVSQRYPSVVDATATLSDDATWRFDVTISSPYDTPERYADAWRVLGDDGTVYGVRELTHDHQDEQPFTRSLSGVELPGGIVSVTIEGRDQHYGWGGDTFVVPLSTT